MSTSLMLETACINPMMTESNYVNSMRGLDWVFVLSDPQYAAALTRPIPVDFILELLDTYIALTAKPLVTRTEDGMRADYDPDGGHRRARPVVELLRKRLETWTACVPVPADIIALARQVLETQRNPEINIPGEPEFDPDFEQHLLWPEAHAGEAQQRS